MDKTNANADRDQAVMAQIADILRIRGVLDGLETAEDVLVFAVARLHEGVLRSRAAELDRHMVWRANLNEPPAEGLPDFFLANFRFGAKTPSELMKPVEVDANRKERWPPPGKPAPFGRHHRQRHGADTVAWPR